MTSIKKDNNSVEVMAGVLNTDGVTPTMVKASVSTHALATSDGSGGTVIASADARRDNNSFPTMLVLASDGSGPIELAVDSSGNLLTKSM